jgi:hypothetical protein
LLTSVPNFTGPPIASPSEHRAPSSASTSARPAR